MRGGIGLELADGPRFSKRGYRVEFMGLEPNAPFFIKGV